MLENAGTFPVRSGDPSTLFSHIISVCADIKSLFSEYSDLDTNPLDEALAILHKSSVSSHIPANPDELFTSIPQEVVFVHPHDSHIGIPYIDTLTTLCQQFSQALRASPLALELANTWQSSYQRSLVLHSRAHSLFAALARAIAPLLQHVLFTPNPCSALPAMDLPADAMSALLEAVVSVLTCITASVSAASFVAPATHAARAARTSVSSPGLSVPPPSLSLHATLDADEQPLLPFPHAGALALLQRAHVQQHTPAHAQPQPHQLAHLPVASPSPSSSASPPAATPPVLPSIVFTAYRPAHAPLAGWTPAVSLPLTPHMPHTQPPQPLQAAQPGPASFLPAPPPHSAPVPFIRPAPTSSTAPHPAPAAPTHPVRASVLRPRHTYAMSPYAQQIALQRNSLYGGNSLYSANPLYGGNPLYAGNSLYGPNSLYGASPPYPLSPLSAADTDAGSHLRSTPHAHAPPASAQPSSSPCPPTAAAQAPPHADAASARAQADPSGSEQPHTSSGEGARDSDNHVSASGSVSASPAPAHPSSSPHPPYLLISLPLPPAPCPPLPTPAALRTLALALGLTAIRLRAALTQRPSSTAASNHATHADAAASSSAAGAAPASPLPPAAVHALLPPLRRAGLLLCRLLPLALAAHPPANLPARTRTSAPSPSPTPPMLPAPQAPAQLDSASAAAAVAPSVPAAAATPASVPSNAPTLSAQSPPRRARPLSAPLLSLCSSLFALCLALPPHPLTHDEHRALRLPLVDIAVNAHEGVDAASASATDTALAPPPSSHALAALHTHLTRERAASMRDYNHALYQYCLSLPPDTSTPTPTSSASPTASTLVSTLPASAHPSSSLYPPASLPRAPSPPAALHALTAWLAYTRHITHPLSTPAAASSAPSSAAPVPASPVPAPTASFTPVAEACLSPAALLHSALAAVQAYVTEHDLFALDLVHTHAQSGGDAACVGDGGQGGDGGVAIEEDPLDVCDMAPGECSWEKHPEQLLIESGFPPSNPPPGPTLPRLAATSTPAALALALASLWRAAALALAAWSPLTVTAEPLLAITRALAHALHGGLDRAEAYVHAPGQCGARVRSAWALLCEAVRDGTRIAAARVVADTPTPASMPLLLPLAQPQSVSAPSAAMPGPPPTPQQPQQCRSVAVLTCVLAQMRWPPTPTPTPMPAPMPAHALLPSPSASPASPTSSPASPLASPLPTVDAITRALTTAALSLARASTASPHLGPQRALHSPTFPQQQLSSPWSLGALARYAARALQQHVNEGSDDRAGGSGGGCGGADADAASLVSPLHLALRMCATPVLSLAASIAPATAATTSTTPTRALASMPSPSSSPSLSSRSPLLPLVETAALAGLALGLGARWEAVAKLPGLWVNTTEVRSEAGQEAWGAVAGTELGTSALATVPAAPAGPLVRACGTLGEALQRACYGPTHDMLARLTAGGGGTSGSVDDVGSAANAAAVSVPPHLCSSLSPVLTHLALVLPLLPTPTPPASSASSAALAALRPLLRSHPLLSLLLSQALARLLCPRWLLRAHALRHTPQALTAAGDGAANGARGGAPGGLSGGVSAMVSGALSTAHAQASLSARTILRPTPLALQHLSSPLALHYRASPAFSLLAPLAEAAAHSLRALPLSARVSARLAPLSVSSAPPQPTPPSSLSQPAPPSASSLLSAAYLSLWRAVMDSAAALAEAGLTLPPHIHADTRDTRVHSSALASIQSNTPDPSLGNLNSAKVTAQTTPEINPTTGFPGASTVAFVGGVIHATVATYTVALLPTASTRDASAHGAGIDGSDGTAEAVSGYLVDSDTDADSVGDGVGSVGEDGAAEDVCVWSFAGGAPGVGPVPTIEHHTALSHNGAPRDGSTASTLAALSFSPRLSANTLANLLPVFLAALCAEALVQLEPLRPQSAASEAALALLQRLAGDEARLLPWRVRTRGRVQWGPAADESGQTSRGWPLALSRHSVPAPAPTPTPLHLPRWLTAEPLAAFADQLQQHQHRPLADQLQHVPETLPPTDPSLPSTLEPDLPSTACLFAVAYGALTRAWMQRMRTISTVVTPADTDPNTNINTNGTSIANTITIGDAAAAVTAAHSPPTTQVTRAATSTDATEDGVPATLATSSRSSQPVPGLLTSLPLALAFLASTHSSSTHSSPSLPPLSTTQPLAAWGALLEVSVACMAPTDARTHTPTRAHTLAHPDRAHTAASEAGVAAPSPVLPAPVSTSALPSSSGVSTSSGPPAASSSSGNNMSAMCDGSLLTAAFPPPLSPPLSLYPSLLALATQGPLTTDPVPPTAPCPLLFPSLLRALFLRLRLHHLALPHTPLLTHLHVLLPVSLLAAVAPLPPLAKLALATALASLRPLLRMSWPRREHLEQRLRGEPRVASAAGGGVVAGASGDGGPSVANARGQQQCMSSSVLAASPSSLPSRAAPRHTLLGSLASLASSLAASASSLQTYLYPTRAPSAVSLPSASPRSPLPPSPLPRAGADANDVVEGSVDGGIADGHDSTAPSVLPALASIPRFLLSYLRILFLFSITHHPAATPLSSLAPLATEITLTLASTHPLPLFTALALVAAATRMLAAPRLLAPTDAAETAEGRAWARVRQLGRMGVEDVERALVPTDAAPAGSHTTATAAAVADTTSAGADAASLPASAHSGTADGSSTAGPPLGTPNTFPAAPASSASALSSALPPHAPPSSPDAAAPHLPPTRATARYLSSLSRALRLATPLLVLAQRLCCFLSVPARDAVLEAIRGAVACAPEVMVVVVDGAEGAVLEAAALMQEGAEEEEGRDAEHAATIGAGPHADNGAPATIDTAPGALPDSGTADTHLGHPAGRRRGRRVLVVDARKRLRASLCEAAVEHKDQFHQSSVLQRLWTE